MALPSGIPGIDYDLVEKCNKLYITYDEYPKIYIPKGIPGINYDLIDKYNKKLINKTNPIKIIRIEPPYTIPCIHQKTINCQKSAAFKDLNNNTHYCWFHMHCKN